MPGQRFNAVKIVTLKSWLRRVGFGQAVLFLTHNQGRNTAFIRITHDSGITDIEALWLDDLRRERLSFEQAQSRILERCGQLIGSAVA